MLACVAIIGHAWLRIHQLYAAYSQSALAFKKLEVGKRANLLLMRRSPLDDIAAYDSVATVWVGGKQVARGELAARE